ncbi:septal ring lytic transglycosylase RlpA family protein [Patescibacteria group bacterium]|nr:septal ring lytic transglycosylase RlpA family protein [Patescibacteria group bacterium]
MKVSTTVKIIGASLIFASLTSGAQAERFIFSDVAEGHKNFVAIEWLRNNNVVSGYLDGSFKPEKEVNRAEALKMVFRCLEIETDLEGEVESFPDVPEESWFSEYVKKAQEMGIVSGYEDGYFRPENTVNLAETLKITFETFGTYPETVEENPFNDVPMDSWFAPYVQAAKEKTALWINLDGNIHPENHLTRGDIADLIYKIKTKNSGNAFGKITYYGGGFNGRGTAFGEIFDENEMTAAHLTLPHNSMVKVTNLENGKEVTVRINDRGPHTEGRVLDLAKAAFEKIAHPGEGLIYGKYEILSTP